MLLAISFRFEAAFFNAHFYQFRHDIPGAAVAERFVLFGIAYIIGISANFDLDLRISFQDLKHIGQLYSGLLHVQLVAGCLKQQVIEIKPVGFAGEGIRGLDKMQ